MTATPYDDVQLFGLTEIGAEPPIAADDQLAQLGATITEALTDGLEEAGLGRLVPALGWGLVNLLHREIERMGRRADEGAAAIRRLMESQDGSEVQDVALQEAMAAQTRTDEMADALGVVREAAAEAYARAVGEPWLPRSGSRTGRVVTAAQIDARDLLSARIRAAKEALDPKGAKIIVSGPVAFADVATVWDTLDRVKERVPNMVLVTKGAAGVELIARKWAATRGVAQITVKPDWGLGTKSVFQANLKALDLKPAGVVLIESPTCRHQGVALNLGQLADARRIRVWRVGTPKDEAAPATPATEAKPVRRKRTGGGRRAA